MERIEIRQARPLIIRHQDWVRTGEYKLWLRSNKRCFTWSPKVQLNLSKSYSCDQRTARLVLKVMLPNRYMAMRMK